jgi:ketosteroid isomerase-like protein
MTPFVYNDGGRRAAGFKGDTGDCVTRAVTIASGKPYAEVYAFMAKMNGEQRVTKRTRQSATRRSARHGVYTRRKWFKDYMASLGFRWTPTMTIGSGCKVHLKADELPAGRLVAHLSRHAVAVIDGVVHDTYDPSRDGTRCVYGYWS